MKTKSLKLICYSACLWVFLPASIFSQHLFPKQEELSRLVQRSDAIVTGEVARLENRWNEDRTRIYTFIYLNVSDSLKGHPGKEIVIKKLGGTVGEMTMKITPDFEFYSGEKVLAFVKQFANDDLYHVTDWKNGKFTLREEGAYNRVSGKLDTKELVERIRSSISRHKRQN